MNKLKLKKLFKGDIIRVITISFFATLACVGIIKAATTIGENISTGGTITGSGANTLYGVTSIGGALTATSTLNVTGLTTLGNASTTLLSVSGTEYIGGADGLILTDGSIADASGSISFGNENLSTTGNINASLAAGTKIVCASDTINPSGCDYTVSNTDAGTRRTTTGGATVTGVIDTAIAALPSGGGTVVLRQGTYNLIPNDDGTVNLLASININKANVTLKCDSGALIQGYDHVAPSQDGVISNAIIVSKNNVTVDGCRISAGANQEIIYLLNAEGAGSGSYIKNITFKNIELYGGTDGITTDWADGVFIVNSYFHDMTGDGGVMVSDLEGPECIEPEVNSRNMVISGNRFYNCGGTVSIWGAIWPHSHDCSDGDSLRNILVSGNTFEGTAGTRRNTGVSSSNGCNVGNTNGATREFHIINNTFLNTGIGFHDSYATALIQGNTIKNNKDTVYSSIYIEDADYEDIVIANNTITGDVSLPAISTGAVNSTAPYGRLVVSGNSIYNNYYGGIDINSCTSVSVANNNIYKNDGVVGSSHGINLSPNGCDISVLGNIIKDSGGVGLRIQNTNGEVTAANNNITWATQSTSYGMYFNSTGRNNITGNLIDNAANGIVLSNTANNNISSNVTSNMSASDLWITGSSVVTADITNNNFKGTSGNNIRVDNGAAHNILMMRNKMFSANIYDGGAINSSLKFRLLDNYTLPPQATVSFGGGSGVTEKLGRVTGAVQLEDLNASYITVTNCGGGTCVLEVSNFDYVKGRIYTVYNNSGNPVIFQMTGGSGTTITNAKTRMFIAGTSDFLPIGAEF